MGRILRRERSKADYRSRCQTEMTISIAVGAFLAMLLCIILPEIEKDAMVGFYMGFWFISAIGVWTVIDIWDQKRGGMHDASENG